VLGDRAQAGKRLRRFLDVYPQVMAGHDATFAYADLRYTNGFAVRWPEAAAPAAGVPRT
jgi:cell division protein FtsQ